MFIMNFSHIIDVIGGLAAGYLAGRFHAWTRRSKP